MKKLTVLILAALLVLSFTACGEKKTTDDADNINGAVTDNDNSANGDELPSDSTDGNMKDDNADNGDENTPDNESDGAAVDILTKVWGEYTDDEKFPAAGGDFSEENVRDGEPGVFSTADKSEIDRVLGFPEAEADCIESAASLIHMMNTNTFTAGAFIVKADTDMDTVAKAISDNIASRHWMCGFPDKYIVITADNFIVTAFGHEELVDTFKDKVTGEYSDAKVVFDEPIS